MLEEMLLDSFTVWQEMQSGFFIGQFQVQWQDLLERKQRTAPGTPSPMMPPLGQEGPAPFGCGRSPASEATGPPLFPAAQEEGQDPDLPCH